MFLPHLTATGRSDGVAGVHIDVGTDTVGGECGQRGYIVKNSVDSAFYTNRDNDDYRYGSTKKN